MKWFKNPSTMEELRKQYRKLMKENHPDVGGTEEAAKEINAEYERLPTWDNATATISLLPVSMP